MSYYLERDIHEVISKCIRNAMKDAVQWGVDYTSTSPSGELRNAVSQALLTRMQRGEDWKEMVDAVYKAVLDFKDAKHAKAIESLDVLQAQSAEERDRYKRALAEFEQQDPMCKRLAALQPMIDKMLPERSESRHMDYTQWIRSRGLVMSAALGLTHLGGGSPKQEVQP